MPRASLSDLLADDVKDYFRREGVNKDDGEKPKRRKRRSRDENRVVFSADGNGNGILKQDESYGANNRDRESPPRQSLNTSPRQSPQRAQHVSPRTQHTRNPSNERNTNLSPADAEFLKRYAEEKERASARQIYQVRSVDRGGDVSARDLDLCDLSNGNNISSYNGNNNNINGGNISNKSISRYINNIGGSIGTVGSSSSSGGINSSSRHPPSRPPTVTGSHRPQLPSIDNDDWEEDDRLERKEWRRERRRLRSGVSVGSRERSGSSGHNRDRSGSGGHLSGHNRERSSSSGGHLSGISSPQKHYRKTSNASALSGYGSIVHTNSYGHWRGNSVGSGSFVRQPWQQDYYNGASNGATNGYNGANTNNDANHGRIDSVGTFVRKESDDTFVRRNEQSSSHANDRTNGADGKTHTRPLSYLSASSDEKSSSGTFKTLPSGYSLRSKESRESEVSALWGGSILESSSPAESDFAYRKRYNDNNFGYRVEDESSEESSYTSDSSSYESEKEALIKRRSVKKPLRLDDAVKVLWDKVWRGILVLELYISNMPSLVGSLALAWSTLGVDWFKWYEETFDTCHPTDYHNKLCTYPEFPGCFTCDTTSIGYQITIHFHYFCSTMAFLLALSLIGKIIIAFPVVRDELANPTTAAPLGLLCMALEKIFGGNFGLVGMGIVGGASVVQTVVAIWFIFISIVYKTLPEPSWFPNTTGLGLAAAKIYLYWTFGGYFLCCLSVVLFMMFYFVALYRIHVNYKISAPVCWVQISGPAVVLYGVSIFGQPGSDLDEIELASSPENIEHFISIHRRLYMPVMHFFFVCSLVSVISAFYLLSIRFKRFREKEFSPAHVSFCAPALSHANAMQVYRSSFKRFTDLPHNHVFKIFLYNYWTICLTSGTILIFIMTWKFLQHLPTWCQIDIDDDEIPPEPEETMLTKLLEKGDAKDEITQDYVSAAVLQANESGALVRVLRDGKMKYMRSRRMPSMGFDPIMTTSQLLSERDRLLEHVTTVQRNDRHVSNSFDDTLSSFYERSGSSRSSSYSSSGSRRNRRNFMSFDASAMMRGEHQ